MKIKFAILTVTLATLCALVPVGALAGGKISVTIRPSTGPRSIPAVSTCPDPKKAKKGAKTALVTFKLKTAGMSKLVTPSTKKPVPGEATIETFVDSIPAIAYKKYNSKHPVANFLGAVATDNFSICLSLPFMKTKGKHTILVALGKSTGVLYSRVKAAKMTETVKIGSREQPAPSKWPKRNSTFATHRSRSGPR